MQVTRCCILLCCTAHSSSPPFPCPCHHPSLHPLPPSLALHPFAVATFCVVAANKNKAQERLTDLKKKIGWAFVLGCSSGYCVYVNIVCHVIMILAVTPHFVANSSIHVRQWLTLFLAPARKREMTTQQRAVLHQAQVGDVAAVVGSVVSVCVLFCRKMWRQS